MAPTTETAGNLQNIGGMWRNASTISPGSYGTFHIIDLLQVGASNMVSSPVALTTRHAEREPISEK